MTTWRALRRGGWAVFALACGTPTFLIVGDAGRTGDGGEGHDATTGAPDAPVTDASPASGRDTGASRDAGASRDTGASRDAGDVDEDSGMKENDAGCATSCMASGCTSTDCSMASCDEHGCCAHAAVAGGTACNTGYCDGLGHCEPCYDESVDKCPSPGTCNHSVCSAEFACAAIQDDAGTPCTGPLNAPGICGAKGACNL